jgi:hypothetical protein
MARIRCHYVGCVHLEDGHCGASLVELDPEEGCQTFTQSDSQLEDDWPEEEEELAEWEDEDYEDWYSDDEDDEFEIDLEPGEDEY